MRRRDLKFRRAPRSRKLLQVACTLLVFVTPAAAQNQSVARAALLARGLEFSEAAFIDRIIEGETAAVSMYLAAGMSANARNPDGNLALWYAAGNRRLEIVELLLAQGADVNADDKRGRTPLAGAITGGSLAVVKRLLDGGANINARARDNGVTPLTLAVSLADPNYENRRGEERAVASLLIERGADPNLASNTGATPLTIAAGICDVELVQALLARGANVNTQAEDGETALLEVTRWSYNEETRQPHPAAPEVIRLLLAHNADPELKDIEGKTALQVAREHRSEALVIALLEPKLKAHLLTRLGYYGYRFNKAQAWFGPVLYLIAVVVALIGLRKPVMPQRQEVEEGDGLPRLAPLKCAQCAAPVPIVPDKMACPSCAAPLAVPEDYRETLTLRAQSAKNFRRAESEWRKAWRYSMPLVTNLLLLVSTLYLAAWLLGLLSPFTLTRPLMAFISIILSGVTLSAGLFFYTFYLMSAHRLLPPLPAIGKEVGREEVAGCRQCGAALAFAAGALVSGCGYCGSESYRVALARSARRVAAEEEATTAVSVYHAVVELEERRKGVFIAVAVIGTAVLLFVLAALAITALLVAAAALLLLYLYLMFS